MNLPARFNHYRYELVAFLTGAAVMVLEIVGARLISPQFGNSTYVWTAMIGVILGALALGFTIGGRLADKNPGSGQLGRIIISAAIALLAVSLFQESVLVTIASWKLDLRLSSLIAAILLFSIPSLLIGMVSPRLAKIRVRSLDTTGRSIGRLEAAGALGSIAGTFSCGYFLLGLFGSRSIVTGIVVLLFITALIAEPFKLTRKHAGVAALVLVIGLLANVNPPGVLADVDTPYARYKIITSDYAGHPSRILVSDTGSIQSAAPLDKSVGPVLSYVQKFYEASNAFPDSSKVLVVGGGMYTFPTELVNTKADVQVHVAEIDPKLKSLAKDYFYYRDSPRISVHHEDGRSFLNTTNQNFDQVYIDAFSSISPPFQLTTAEMVGRVQNSLNPGGAVIVNAIGRVTDNRSEYLQALRQTYASEFKHVGIIPASPSLSQEQIRQNYLLLATDSLATYEKMLRTTQGVPVELADGGRVFTDDFAPIERLTY